MMPTLVLHGPSKKLSHTMKDDAQEECPTYSDDFNTSFSCSLFWSLLPPPMSIFHNNNDFFSDLWQKSKLLGWNGEDLSPFYLMSPRILFQGHVWGGCKGLSWGEEFGLIGLPFTANTKETNKVTHRKNMHTNHHTTIFETFHCIALFIGE